MKKFLSVIVITFICFFTFSDSKAFAVDTVIKVDGPTAVKKGEKVEYKISIRGVNRLYAGSIDIKFNNDNISFKQIKAGEFINKDGVNKMEFGGEPNSDNNKISYQFTCTGKVDGFSGDGVLAAVTAEGVKDCEINLKDCLSIQICERTKANDIVDIKYSYDKTDVMSESNSNKRNENADDNSSTKEDTKNNTGIKEHNTDKDSEKNDSTSTKKDENNIVDKNPTSDKDDKITEIQQYNFVVYGILGIGVIIGSGLLWKKVVRMKKNK